MHGFQASEKLQSLQGAAYLEASGQPVLVDLVHLHIITLLTDIVAWGMLVNHDVLACALQATECR